MTASSERFKRELSAFRGRSLIIGVCGGSCSGKTTLARLIQAEIGPGLSAVLYQDAYYIDQSLRFDGDGGRVNFDHPSALDFALMRDHLAELARGRAVQVPVYDFATHTRLPRTEEFPPRPLILVDGFLILHAPELRDSFDFSIFISASERRRFERRLARDVQERGREPEGVHKQFQSQVKPMHDQFVEPSRHRADLLISGEESVGAELDRAIEAILSRRR